MFKGFWEWLILEKCKKLPCFLVIGGSESFHIKRAVNYIRSNICLNGVYSINYERIDILQDNFQYVVNTLSSLPLIENRKRLIEVYLSNIESLSLIHRINSDVKKLIKNNVLIFILEKKMFFQTLNFFENNNVIFFFKKRKKWEVNKIIMKFLKEKQILLDENVINFLVMNFSGSFWYIDNILNKLQLIGNNRTFTINDIKEKIISENFTDVFSFSLAVVEGKKTLAMKLLFCLENRGEFPLKILGILSWHFRVVLKSIIFIQKGYSLSNISKKINIYGYHSHNILLLSKNILLSNLKYKFSLLRSLDFSIKNSKSFSNSFIIMYQIISKLF